MLSAAVKNKIEQIWLDFIAGGVSQPTEVIEQLTYLMFAKQIDQDTPFGLLIRKIAKMDRDAAYAAFSTFIAEERPNAEQIHFIEQVVDYVVENGYINNVLDLMKAPFDRPYKFSVIFTREEQIKFVQVINSIKSNALVA